MNQGTAIITTNKTRTDLTAEQTGDLVKLLRVAQRNLNLGDRTIVTDPAQVERCKKIAAEMATILNDAIGK